MKRPLHDPGEMGDSYLKKVQKRRMTRGAYPPITDGADRSSDRPSDKEEKAKTYFNMGEIEVNSFG